MDHAFVVMDERRRARRADEHLTAAATAVRACYRSRAPTAHGVRTAERPHGVLRRSASELQQKAGELFSGEQSFYNGASATL